MPLFFFISGYLFNPNYLDNKKQFVIKRVKKLYWPYVKWSLIFLVFHNVLSNCGFYENIYSIADMVKRAFLSLTFRGTESLLGGFWFLKSLFLASIAALISLSICRKWLLNVVKHDLLIILLLFFIAVAYVFKYTPFNIPFIDGPSVMATIYFLVGFMYRQSTSTKNVWVGALALCLVLLFTQHFGKSYNMQVLFSVGYKGYEILLYLLISIIGTIGVINLCSGIQGCVADFLDYVGKNTLYILIWHFTAFKLVSIIKIEYYRYDWSMLHYFPVISQDNTWFWVIYAIVGISIPILGCLLWDRLTQKVNIRS